ncbi:hypothetical protein ATN89_17440 [Comamonas thiooxydans]|uniref:C40 family peptidase n=1 Tax=Comamonas thiooxydans TaxID=363952 RepID=UPI0007CD2607|nr:C40 family peptidase [Comamonas thiooxydans]OAD82866.1 hypothetical protein ATN89_17440 [Comamonas thiooxydans]
MQELEEEMTPALQQAMQEHAQREFPKEACGLLVRAAGGIKYVPCANISDKPGDYFAISDTDYRAAEDMGELVGVFHSHPNYIHLPSDFDLASCQRSGLPWVILSWPAGRWSYTQPDFENRPLYQREFHHGSFDCFGFVQAWYWQTHGIKLDTPVREDEWWAKGQNLYLDNYKKWGFERVQDTEALRIGDVLLMQVLSDVPNHAAVVVGDDLIGHHLYGRLSSKDVYGGYWRRHTTHVMRHKGVKHDA